MTRGQLLCAESLWLCIHWGFSLLLRPQSFSRVVKALRISHASNARIVDININKTSQSTNEFVLVGRGIHVGNACCR